MHQPWQDKGPEKGLCSLPALLQGAREEGAFPHGSHPCNVTPAKLDTTVPQETPRGQHPPAPHLQPGTPSPTAALPHASPAPHGSASGGRRDVATVTDLCSGDVPEVEIISLLGEPLPRYTLRADTVFGYDHDDWLRVPLSPLEPPAPLTPQQIEETLQYFLLCAERVVRITKTYHDIDAVTNLLDEKERDLELAARIGQSLLKQNRSLTERNELLEEQLELAKEEIAQLRHEVSMRDDLLHFYTTTTEESEPTATTSTPLRQNESSLSLQQYLQYDTLQQKLKCLEEENQKLRMEATNIATETSQYEDQEQQLMIDCVEQFSEASQQVVYRWEERARKAEDTARQQEEISQLLAQVVDLQQKCRTYGSEVEELQQHLALAKEVQQQLRTELRDLQEKYAEWGGLTAGSGFSLSSLSYLPDKLQIVKPLEGSVTLHHWQQLARPNLGGILVPRPGVLTKDFRQLDIDLEEVYSLNDLEEDDVDAGSFQLLPTSTPAKAKERPGVFLSVNNLPQTPSTFTTTTCHILHPITEVTTVTPSLCNAFMSSCGPLEGLSCGSPLLEKSSPVLTPAPGPLSTPLGLVRLLLVRGISASVPGTGSWWGPLLPLQEPQDAGTCPSPAPGGQEGPRPTSSTFSFNLVEKLRRLGLNRVVVGGGMSYTPGELT
ncbi:PREDICTED: huntingtin-associated protein 1 [Chaetura pelagica]|uniref:huntingtin-associated protein 1 n=1 Tax=Chaetura pelagica TaxID=8897 RepID=UPI000523A736|nr:PREDICTED: huntingtin-associated protein 1 [Chaetura pelagica]